MKIKVLLLIIVLFSFVSPVYAQGPQPAEQPVEETSIIPNCSRIQLREWLYNRRAAMLATGDVLEAMSKDLYPITQGIVVIQEHAFILFSYEHPQCAETLLSWTLFMYMTTVESIMCAENEFQCASYAENRIYMFRYMQDLLGNPLYHYAGINTSTDEWMYTLRPDGWTEAWEAELSKEKPNNNIQS